MLKSKNEITGVIPARYGSTRFPGKPLVNIAGKPMIQHVYEACIESALFDELFIATDDKRIQEIVIGFGAQCIMTSSLCQSGTERIAEAIKLGNIQSDIIVNIQGDEPGIKKSQLENVISLFNSKEVGIASLYKKFGTEEDPNDPNKVKVIFNAQKEAIYFSRSLIPYNRSKQDVDYFKHIGIYAFRNSILKEIAKLKPTKLEEYESLEQLRWIENNYSIHLAETNIENISIDTPDDLKDFLKII